MLSRWYMTESVSDDRRLPENPSGANRLLQVQYAFLELPKLPAGKPDSGVLQWAWLFVHAPELTEVPAYLPQGPHRAALELANEATFSQLERNAYRKVIDEIQQAREYGAAQRVEGKVEGKIEAKAEAVLALLSRRGIPVSDEARARIEACADIATLDLWFARAITASSTEEVFARAS
jgi:hypothetical protein